MGVGVGLKAIPEPLKRHGYPPDLDLILVKNAEQHAVPTAAEAVTSHALQVTEPMKKLCTQLHTFKSWTSVDRAGAGRR